IACRNWESNFSLLGPLTRVEKKLVASAFSFSQLLAI
ncbi:hypothetical protein AXF05_09580, partial [Staphylococcus aureus]|nr:hypothetical protein [Staphylococcus aureus]